MASHLDGDDSDARPMFDQSLRIARRNGHLFLVAYGQLGLALVASRAGDMQAAAALHGAADAIFEKLGTGATRFDVLESRLRDADITRLRGALGDAVFETAYSTGLHSKDT